MYPRTIDDGHGSRMTFLRVTYDDETGVERLELTGTVDPGAGPPEHIHHLQREAVTVRSGRIGFVVDGGAERSPAPASASSSSRASRTASGTPAPTSSSSTARSRHPTTSSGSSPRSTARSPPTAAARAPSTPPTS